MILRLLFVTTITAFLFIAAVLFIHSQSRFPNTHNECVILMHGLCRSALSMKLIENYLKQNGYSVVNIDYASTRKTIAEVADTDVALAVIDCKHRGYDRIHFATHYLGAVVVRKYLQAGQLPKGSRIVMLAPPSQGSELADRAMEKFHRLSRLAGPAARQLGTGQMTVLKELFPLQQEVGIIIGNDSWNPLSSKILPGSDDGKVAVERAKLEEMRDFLVAPCNHTTIFTYVPPLLNILFSLGKAS